MKTMTPFLFLILVIAGLGLLLNSYEPRRGGAQPLSGQESSNVAVGPAGSADPESLLDRIRSASGSTWANWALVVVGSIAAVLALQSLGTLQRQTRASQQSAL